MLNSNNNNFVCKDDDSRVALQCNNEHESDYINASYIDVRRLLHIPYNV